VVKNGRIRTARLPKEAKNDPVNRFLVRGSRIHLVGLRR